MHTRELTAQYRHHPGTEQEQRDHLDSQVHERTRYVGDDPVPNRHAGRTRVGRPA